MSTITLSRAKKLVGDRNCHIGDFLYMAPIAVPSSLGSAIGIGATVKTQNLMSRPKQLEQKLHSKTTSYFASCPIRLSVGNRVARTRRRWR
jgi:hypothetical protein